MTAGGNLSLLTGSVGTATAWTPPRAIVLVEDDYEDAPRIDIMLTHLRRSGYFANAAAVVAGTFVHLGESSQEETQAVLDDRLGDLGIPVIANANLGHGGHVQTWPIGVPARLDADSCVITLLEKPLV